MSNGIQTGKTTREQFSTMDSEEREWRMFSAIETIQEQPIECLKKFDERYVKRSWFHSKITYGIVGAVVILYAAASIVGLV